MSTFTFVPRHPPRRTKVKRSYACAGKDDHFPTPQEGKAQKEGIITSTQRNGTLSGKLYKAIQRERNARRKEKKSQRLAADEIESNKNKGYDTVEGVGHNMKVLLVTFIVAVVCFCQGKSPSSPPPSSTRVLRLTD